MCAIFTNVSVNSVTRPWPTRPISLATRPSRWSKRSSAREASRSPAKLTTSPGPDSSKPVGGSANACCISVHPYLRGDDVAELQVRLARLGFNPGRIDGIFGPLLEAALGDFQGNCGLEVNGTLTRRTLLELTRVTPSTSTRNLVNEARDVAGFSEEASGPIVLCGTSPLRDLLEVALRAERQVIALGDSTSVEVATFANDHQAIIVLSLSRSSTDLAMDFVSTTGPAIVLTRDEEKCSRARSPPRSQRVTLRRGSKSRGWRYQSCARPG